MGYPPPPVIFGIIDLEENLKVIYGAQAFTGKILIAKNLRACAHLSLMPLLPSRIFRLLKHRRKVRCHIGLWISRSAQRNSE